MKTACIAFAAAVAMVGAPTRAHADVPDPTVTLPPDGVRGHALWDSWYSLDDLGYAEQEYFVSGTARAGEAEAPYTTRIIVRRPVEGFNGTVLLDWVNVTAQFENAVDTLEAHPQLMRERWAFVHVSAQAAGLCCAPFLTPKMWDPVRYAAIDHPGDDFSFDIFSQVAKAVRTMTGASRVIAAGQSQSAGRLSTYVRRVQPDAGVIDGFLIHSGGSKTFDTPPSVPVLHLASDAEASVTEPNTADNYTLWEIAGSSHSDFWVDYHQEIGQGPRAIASAPQQDGSADEDLHATAGNYGEQVHPRQFTCIAGGSLFPIRYAVSAALHHLDAWIRSGLRPLSGPRFEFDADGALARDEHGNALGGIRLPPIEVPVAEYVSTLCVLGGITIPFDPVKLQTLYPTHADYVCRMQEATDRSVSDGFLLPEDALDLMTRARAAGNRWLDAGTPTC